MSAPTVEQPGTDIARVDTSQALTLRASMDYARALAESNMLPAQFRKQPANVLWAMEYGRTIGLSPMAAITGVHVIEGKPSASAGLISGLVRRAGHKLRVTGDAQTATCTIIRSDDPDHPFVVTFTMDDARTAGLANKNTWKQYPSSMLKARAISQCARDACEEVLFGLHYTPEELGAEVDEEGHVVTATVATVTPLPNQPSPAEVAAQIATMAAACADAEKLRATWQEAGTRGLLAEDVWQAVGYQAGARGISTGDLSLDAWLRHCGSTVTETGTSVDAVILTADADDTDEAEVINEGVEQEALL
jgi:hypothetical protein